MCKLQPRSGDCFFNHKLVRFLSEFPNFIFKNLHCLWKIMTATRLVLLVGIWLSAIYVDRVDSSKVSRDATAIESNACTNCSICQNACHQLSPPPPPPYGNPVYGGAPPPAPPSGYPVYSDPPSPINCPPFPAQCCNFPPPYPYGYQPYVMNNSVISCSPLVSIQLVLLLVATVV